MDPGILKIILSSVTGSTRPVYEKKLLKLIGSGSAVPTVKQNGAGDVGRYSDSEEDERGNCPLHLPAVI